MMNPIMDSILNRKSVRVFEDQAISSDIRNQILTAAMRAPTAGNLMLYTIVEVNDQKKKNTLAKTCDNQPFIAKAPWVLLFLADYQRWYDYFLASGVEEFCEREKLPFRKPEEGDLLLACCDAIIAAQTAVIAAESFGIGTCYIGDIMENYEIHRELFDLPLFTFPICLLCLGYPTRAQVERPITARFDSEFIIFRDNYKRLNKVEQKKMFSQLHKETFKRQTLEGASNIGQLVYRRKFSSQFAAEMNRSVRVILKTWTEGK